jgi:hypothetical protein
MVPRVADVNISQFRTEKLTEIPFSCFPITHVPPMNKLKTKNKDFKPYGQRNI